MANGHSIQSMQEFRTILQSSKIRNKHIELRLLMISERMIGPAHMKKHR